MKKMLSILFLILIAGFIVTSSGKQKDGSEIYRNMVNYEFAIALNQSNSTVEFAHSALSIDSIYAICFNLTDEYSTFLRNQNIFVKENIDLLMKEYVEPYIYLIDGLETMIRDSETEQCYLALNLKHAPYREYECIVSISMLLLNSEKNKLYWFHYSI